MKKLFTFLVVLFTMTAAAQESALLRLNYASGDSYIMDLQLSQDMGTMMSMDMGMKMKQTITSVSGDTYESTMKIASIAMDMSQGGMNVSYDSSKSDDELDASGKMMQAQMVPMLQAVISMKGNNLGEVSETTVEPNVPGTADLAKQSSGVVYPKEAVRVGDTWTMSKSDKGMTMDFVYTVASIAKEVVVLDVSGKVAGMAEGSITGKINVDRNSGVPSTSNIAMDMAAQGQKMSIKTTITMTKQ